VSSRVDSATRPIRGAIELIESRLTPLLGRHTAANAVRTFSRSALGKSPAELTVADLPPLLRALRPMLRVLCGVAVAQALLDGLREELDIHEVC
jgi:hypothetical protein